jgi:hypothetical protein
LDPGLDRIVRRRKTGRVRNLHALIAALKIETYTRHGIGKACANQQGSVVAIDGIQAVALAWPPTQNASKWSNAS